MSAIRAAKIWRNNAELMVDVAQLGYLGNEGSMVLDVTYGRGKFWSRYRPVWLVKCDNRPLPGVEYVTDFRTLPFEDSTADIVVMDPPYRLNGTPDERYEDDEGDFNDRYGVQETMSWQEKMAMIHDGIKECARVVKPKGFFLLKCQDQVCSGAVRWQTIYFSQQANANGLTLFDRFDMVPKSVPPQPKGRRQAHAWGRPSTLLVFQKRKGKKQ